MITLKKLAFQIREDLDGGRSSKDSPYRIAYIIAAIREAMNEELGLSLLRRRGGDFDDDRSAVSQYIANYPDQVVKKEASSGRAYIDIPDFYISMKYNKGIHGVSDMKDILKNHIPFHNPGVAINTPGASLEEDNFGYYINGQKIYWVKDILKFKITHVNLQLIVAAPESIGEDDALPVTPEVLGRVRDNVKSRIYKRTVQDKILDNNKDIGTNVPG